MALRTIVVGVDESDGAAHALRWAAAEGAIHDAEVKAVLAWTLLDQHRAITGVGFEADYGEADASDALQSYVTRVLDDELAGSVRTSAVCDLPAPALLEAAADADLLVVGARGMGGFRGLLLGSVSSQCLHRATMPVAIIRSPLAGRAQDRIVVGIDGSHTAQRALHWAVGEAVARTADLDVVTVYEDFAHAGIVVPVPAASPSENAAALLDRALACEDICAVPAVSKIVLHGGVAGAVLAHAVGASLLVVGSRREGAFKRAMFGSVATQLSHHAPCPLVVIPAVDDDVR